MNNCYIQKFGLFLVLSLFVFKSNAQCPDDNNLTLDMTPTFNGTNSTYAELSVSFMVTTQL